MLQPIESLPIAAADEGGHMIANQMISIPSEKAVVGVAKLSGSVASSISIADLKGKENFVIFPGFLELSNHPRKSATSRSFAVLMGLYGGIIPGVSNLQFGLMLPLIKVMVQCTVSR